MRSLILLFVALLSACGQFLSVSGAAPGEDGGTPRSDDSSPASSQVTIDTKDAGAFAFEPSRGEPVFFDAFDRADAPDLGSGWLVKTPGSFRVRSGEAEQSSSSPLVVQDLVVLRPESILDAEVRVTVTFATEVSSRSYMLLVRAQPSSEKPMWVEAYALSFRSDRFQLGPTTTSKGIARTISPPLTEGSRYVVSLRVRGIDPVVLEGEIATADGAAIVSARFQDEDVFRIQASGRVGFGGGAFGGRWDDFARFDL